MDASENETVPLAVRLLGPFDVQVEGKPMRRLATRKRQWLLALLTLRNGRELQRGWLAGTLWPESTESQALANLRQSLAELRRVLGSHANRVVSTPHTVRLDLTGAYADVVRFDESAAREDAGSLKRAIALYRGDLLEGCTEEWVFQEREIRRHAWMKALETLADHCLKQGEFVEAVGLLRQAVAADRFAEGLHCALMEALAENGDYAAVTQAYRELRNLLHRELNTGPAAATTALFQRLQKAARKSIVGAESGESPLAAATHIVSSVRLPRPRTSFIGREPERDEVKAALDGSRLVTLTGTGGIGKTRLAIQAATELKEAFSDGVCFVELASVTDGALLPQAVADALDLREEPGHPILATLLNALESRHLLLVLDNCEHLIEDCARFADTLLERCPELRLLATSRQALNVAGESIRRVPSLPLPPLLRLPADKTADAGPAELLESDAARLFLERAAANEPGFRLTPANALAVARICHALEGIPLALELAAARVKVMSVEQIAARLDDCFRLLKSSIGTAPTRQQTLRAAIDWSYALLTDKERILLRRLSVFAGGWTLEAAEFVGSLLTEEKGEGGPLTSWEILDLLECLVDKSLVMAETSSSEARYRMLETIRQYGRERLIASGELEAARARHRDFYLALSERAAPLLRGSEQAEWLECLEREHDNCRAALANPSADEKRLRLAVSMTEFRLLRGHVREGRESLEDALAGAEGDHALRSRALISIGMLSERQGDLAAAQSWFVQSLAMCRKQNDHAGASRALNSLGSSLLLQGKYAEARTHLAEGLAMCRENSDRLGMAVSLDNLGRIAFDLQEYTLARELFEEALAIQRSAGNLARVANLLNGIGNVCSDQKDFATSRRLYEEAMEIQSRLGDSSGTAWTLNNLGCSTHEQGDLERADGYHREALRIRGELGEKNSITYSLFNLGNVAGDRGEHEKAYAYYTECLRMCREIGNTYVMAHAFTALANLAVVGNRMRRAALLYGAANSVCESSGKASNRSEREEVARQTLGEEAFAVAWAEGAALSLEGAVALALNTEE